MLEMSRSNAWMETWCYKSSVAPLRNSSVRIRGQVRERLSSEQTGVCDEQRLNEQYSCIAVLNVQFRFQFVSE